METTEACTPVPAATTPEPWGERARLAALAGRPCPRCGWPVSFDGRRLHSACGYSWNNPDGAEAEIAPAPARKGAA